jgi:hypothetical protein
MLNIKTIKFIKLSKSKIKSKNFKINSQIKKIKFIIKNSKNSFMEVLDLDYELSNLRYRGVNLNLDEK